MTKYFVIVESPAKKGKIKKFLESISPKDTFIVEASYGHIVKFEGLKSIFVKEGRIRGPIKSKKLSTKVKFEPEYVVDDDSKKVMASLTALVKKVGKKNVIIATDLDREGEAIGYHLMQQLKLPKTTKRIHFNEITRDAVEVAFKNPTRLNMDMINAQQARSVLDILIGYSITPLVWKIVQNYKLSAGRCQTPALKLIYERHKEIEDFTSQSSYLLTADFKVGKKNINEAKYKSPIKDKTTATKLLKKLIPLTYTLKLHSVNKTSTNPPPPFITSSIQQEASNRLGMSPKSTMSVLQKLYEKGLITYMRTDSPAISASAAKECKTYIDTNHVGLYKSRVYTPKGKNAQEAHECIRPTSMKTTSITGASKKMYRMIWIRTMSCFMKEYISETTTFRFTSNTEYFEIKKKTSVELGYKLLEPDSVIDEKTMIAYFKKYVAQTFKPEKIIGQQVFSNPTSMYTEASLVKGLEKKGIGRPSTFSSIVTKLLVRNYAEKEERELDPIELSTLTIKKSSKKVTTKTISKERKISKNKLQITDLGIKIIEYLQKQFPDTICSYSYTSEMNDQLDDIASGSKDWHKVVRTGYNSFIDKVIAEKKKKVKKPTFKKTKIGASKYSFYKDLYSFVVLRKNDDGSEDKRRMQDLKEDSIKLTTIKALFKYPLEKGEFEGKKVYIKKGRYGIYCEIGTDRFSLDSDTYTLEELVELQKTNGKKVIKSWDEIMILKGPYSPYIKKGDMNIKIPKGTDIDKLTKLKVNKIIKAHMLKKGKK